MRFSPPVVTFFVGVSMFIIGLALARFWRWKDAKKESDSYQEIKALRLSSKDRLSEIELRNLFGLAYFYDDHDLDAIHARASRDLGEIKATILYREIYSDLNNSQKTK